MLGGGISLSELNSQQMRWTEDQAGGSPRALWQVTGFECGGRSALHPQAVQSGQGRCQRRARELLAPARPLSSKYSLWVQFWRQAWCCHFTCLHWGGAAQHCREDGSDGSPLATWGAPNSPGLRRIHLGRHGPWPKKGRNWFVGHVISPFWEAQPAGEGGLSPCMGEVITVS